MANKTAAIYMNYKKADGTWGFAKPLVKGNGRLKPLWIVLADGTGELHPEARYKVMWYESGKKKSEDAGQDPDVALATLSRREKSLDAKAEGLTVLDDKESKGRVLLSAAIAVYVDDAADSTTVLWSGSTAASLGVGEQFCDAIALTLDSAHDYWIAVHGTSSANLKVSTTVPTQLLGAGYLTGDQTGVTTVVPSATEIAISRVISA